MPTLATHALVGLGLAEVFEAAAGVAPGPRLWGLSAGLAMLPDLDALAFPLGIRYEHRFGHRGILHSLAFAALAGSLTALAVHSVLGIPWWLLAGYFFAVTASHGLLDAFTNGGCGIALLAPFDDTRYFFWWQPIQVAPLGWAFFSRWGLRVLVSEAVWVWAPLAVLVGAAALRDG